MSLRRFKDHSVPGCPREFAGCRKLLRAGSILLAVLLSSLWFAASVNTAEPSQSQERRLSLRAAIVDLSATFGSEYPRGSQFLARLDEFERLLASAPLAEQAKLQSQLHLLERESLTANPLLRIQPILYVVRHQYRPDHHATETMFQNGEINTSSFEGGGALRAIDFAKGGSIRTIVDAGPSGVVRDPTVRFDGKRIVFSMRRNRDDDYHIYEVDADGRNLRQITSGSMIADIGPAYLPNGKIVFSSTRDVKYCQCNRHISPNLFLMEADGRNILQIGRNNLGELHAAVLPDGRILYDRWEYVDRHFGPSYGLWTCNPDGTNHALYYGSNAWSPGAIIQARPIPGGDRVVCIFGSCHDRPWGAMTIVDRRRGLDGTAPVVQMWPAGAIRLLDGIDNASMEFIDRIDSFSQVSPKYEDPWPLADALGRGAGKYFLVSRSLGGACLAGEKPPSDPLRMAMFLVDAFGNETLLHDEEPGCFDPKPLAACARPPVIPERIDLARSEGFFYVDDVYRGSGMEQVPRGTIKYLRVVEAPPKRSWSQPAYGINATQAPAMNWNLTVNKRILGDVPVEADGSAYFAAPAGRFLYFQALDADKLMVQSMRSGTTLMPGEFAGCTGCHEKRLDAPSRQSTDPAAMRRLPSRLKDWYGPERDFNYLTEVQPVFDRRCVSCHDYGRPEGKAINLAGDVGMVFNTSYVELQGRSAVCWAPDRPDSKKLLVKAVHDGPPAVLPPYAWGSHRSRLIDVLRADHYGVKLSHEEFERIVTWIDLNTPYYGSYFSAYRDNSFGRSPLTEQQYRQLVQLTGERQLPEMASDVRNHGLNLVNFTRPELSPVLAAVGDPSNARYREALEIIRAGKSQLARQPREDMLGPAAQPLVPFDRERIERLESHRQREAATRAAILNSRNVGSATP